MSEPDTHPSKTNSASLLEAVEKTNPDVDDFLFELREKTKRQIEENKLERENLRDYIEENFDIDIDQVPQPQPPPEKKIARKHGPDKGTKYAPRVTEKKIVTKFRCTKEVHEFLMSIPLPEKNDEYIFMEDHRTKNSTLKKKKLRRIPENEKVRPNKLRMEERVEFLIKELLKTQREKKYLEDREKDEIHFIKNYLRKLSEYFYASYIFLAEKDFENSGKALNEMDHAHQKLMEKINELNINPFKDYRITSTERSYLRFYNSYKKNTQYYVEKIFELNKIHKKVLKSSEFEKWSQGIYDRTEVQ